MLKMSGVMHTFSYLDILKSLVSNQHHFCSVFSFLFFFFSFPSVFLINPQREKRKILSIMELDEYWEERENIIYLKIYTMSDKCSGVRGWSSCSVLHCM